MTATLDTIRALLGRPTIHGFQARHGLETFAHVACSALGLPPVRVHWQAGVQTAAINRSGDLMLSDIRDDAQVQRSQFVRWVGYVVHELLHRRYTDFGARDGRSYVDALHNALEDAWIESRAIREGLLGNIGGVLRELIDGMTSEAIASGHDWSDPRQYPYSIAVYTRPHASIKAPVPATLLPVWREALARIAQAQSSSETLAVARWVYDQLQIPPQQQQQQQQQGSQQQQQSKTGGSQAGGAQAGDDQDAQDGDAQDAQDGKPRAGYAEAPDAGPAQTPKPHQGTLDTEPEMMGGGGAGFGPTGVLERAALHSFDRYEIKHQIPGTLRYQVRRLLECSGREDLDSHRLAGSLDTRRIAASAWTERVFARRIEEAGIEAAVVVLLDMSGSMGGERAPVAIPAALALLETIEAAQASVLGAVFGDEVAPFKRWTETVRRATPQARRLMLAGGTNDYYAIRWAHDQLLRHPAPRKVVLVLTDGVGDGYKASAQIASGSRLGIQTIGIGIQADVSNVYGHGSPCVISLEDLGRVAFQQIKRAA